MVQTESYEKEAKKLAEELKVGDEAIMGEDFENSCKVKIESISFNRYSVVVSEVKTNKKWTVSAELITPITSKNG